MKSTVLYCRVPKDLTKDELKEIVGKQIVNAMNIHFVCNPKKTTFDVNNRNQIRRKGKNMYTLHSK